jgi:hypothetical protein
LIRRFIRLISAPFGKLFRLCRRALHQFSRSRLSHDTRPSAVTFDANSPVKKKPRAMPTSADKQSEHDTRAVWFFFGELMRLTGGKVGQGAGSRFVHRMWGHLSEITFSFRERWVAEKMDQIPAAL